MKKAQILILTIILCIGSFSVTAQSNSQFKKPIQPAYSPNASNDAAYNIGITGGGTLTEWIHLGGSNTHFKQPIPKSIGIIGGVAFEKVLNSHYTIGIEALYAMRQTELTHTLVNFPVGVDEYNDIVKKFDVNYNEVAVQVPFTMYFNNTPNATMRPYIFAAPRFSLPLSGNMYWQKQSYKDGELMEHPSIPNQADTIAMSSSNFKPYNAGVVLGAGMQMRVNLNSYYFLVKLDASYHVGFINTHTQKEINDDINHVIGSGYIEPALLEKRFSTDANLKLSIFLPLKKQLKGACMSWGEYD